MDTTTEDFLASYKLLTKKQQTIFEYLHWFGRNYRSVFPSMERISDMCQCCRRTVIRAIKTFEGRGWLFVIRRFWQTCIYAVNEILLKFDLKNPETFKRKPPPFEKPNVTENVTENVTPILSSREQTMNGNVRDREIVQDSKSDFERRFSGRLKELELLNLSRKDKLIIAYLDLSEYEIALAREDVRTYSKKVKNLAALLIDRAYSYRLKFRGIPKPTKKEKNHDRNKFERTCL